MKVTFPLKMRGEVHILVYCPIDTSLKEKRHSAMVHDSYMFFTKNEIRDKMRVNEDFKKEIHCVTQLVSINL